uniref:TAP-C domain-containing protein n=1 Tax=Anopheles epiroticus TaxID=199890 RepID=A0A182PBU9_9DIPT
MNMETAHLVTEFITHTGANKQDAVSCLKSWEWDLKKALIDYNASTIIYININVTFVRISVSFNATISSDIDAIIGYI